MYVISSQPMGKSKSAIDKLDNLVGRISSVEETPLADVSVADENLRRVASYFQVDVKEWDSYKDRVNVLHEWGKKNAKSEEVVDVMWALKSLENRLNTPSIGEKRINHVYKWVRLQAEKDKIEKEQKLYERDVGSG